MIEESRKYVASRVGKGDVPIPTFDDEALARTRALRADVFSRWDAVIPGESLELRFGA